MKPNMGQYISAWAARYGAHTCQEAPNQPSSKRLKSFPKKFCGSTKKTPTTAWRFPKMSSSPTGCPSRIFWVNPQWTDNFFRIFKKLLHFRAQKPQAFHHPGRATIAGRIALYWGASFGSPVFWGPNIQCSESRGTWIWSCFGS